MADWTVADGIAAWRGKYLDALFIARPHRASQLLFRRTTTLGGLPESYRALSFQEVAELKTLLDRLFIMGGDEEDGSE